MKKPYKLTITRQINGKTRRNTFDLDGLLLIGTRVEEHQNAIVCEGQHWPFLTAQKAVEAVCAGRDAEFIQQLRGHLNNVLAALIEESLPLIGRIEEEAPAPLDLKEGMGDD